MLVVVGFEECKMKFCVAFVSLFTTVLSGPVGPAIQEVIDGSRMEYFLTETTAGVYELEDLVHADLDTRASETDIIYYFYSRNNPARGTKVESNNVGVLRNTDFRASKETLFIVHGWRNSNESAVNYHVREAILSRHDINVFAVDWGTIASRNYLSAKNSVVTVGRFIANFVRSLVSTYGLPLSNVAFVGHSLGAHVSGNAGAALGSQVDHIVGLDPAGPLFSVNNINERLDPTDARFVQIIHTNGGLLGFSASSGHSDYFPNGGSSQPGCGVDLAGSCAHSRAYAYYAEAIESRTNSFSSRRCTSYSDFTGGRCNSNLASFMGGYGVDSRANGNYYLQTNSRSPFAQG